MRQSSAMNPYAAPVSDPEEDRTDPAFQVIRAIPRATIGMLFVPGVLFVGSYLFVMARISRAGSYFPMLGVIVVTQLFSPLGMILHNAWNRRKIRNHPLVRSGQALYGGIGGLGKGPRALRGASRGILVITRDAVSFSSLATGGQITVPLREIEEVTVRRHLLIYRIVLDLHLQSGAVTTLSIPRAKLWKKLIDQSRAAVAVVSGRAPEILP